MNAIEQPVNETQSAQPGRLSRALIRMFMKQAQVIDCEAVAEGFKLITLESPQLRDIDWQPGHKIQIGMGSAFVARTFTPIKWNAAAGHTRILGYAHGDGPGSAWLARVQVGDQCDIFGPRASLAAPGGSTALVIVGDETAIGLAYAIKRQQSARPVACLLEVNALAPVCQVLVRLDLVEAELFPRTADDGHLQQLAQRLAAPAAGGAEFVLSGKASSIQKLRHVLKNLGVPAARMATKAYWATGKCGLD